MCFFFIALSANVVLLSLCKQTNSTRPKAPTPIVAILSKDPSVILNIIATFYEINVKKQCKTRSTSKNVGNAKAEILEET